MNERLANVLAAIFLLAIIGVVFQQIATSMSEQGIASGGPYDNAAAYPRAVAIVIVVLLLVQGSVGWLSSRRASRNGTEASSGQASGQSSGQASASNTDAGDTPLRRAVALLVIFAVYLGLLQPLGYHLTTTPMLIAVMVLCGVRRPGVLLGTSLLIAFLLAFIFEHFLKIVLPGGLFALNLPW